MSDTMRCYGCNGWGSMGSLCGLFIRKTCPICHGDGVLPDDRPQVGYCEDCGGSGRNDMDELFSYDCGTCRGSGRKMPKQPFFLVRWWRTITFCRKEEVTNAQDTN